MMKHYNIKLQHMCDYISEHLIALHYCLTENMIADMLTKPLPHPKLTHLKQLANICNYEELNDDLGQRGILE